MSTFERLAVCFVGAALLASGTGQAGPDFGRPATADEVAAWDISIPPDGRGLPTSHEVTVAAADLALLAPGAADPADLVRRSFAFLLVREPKESILRRFDLVEIGRYFPEYERTVRP